MSPLFLSLSTSCLHIYPFSKGPVRKNGYNTVGCGQSLAFFGALCWMDFRMDGLNDSTLLLPLKQIQHLAKVTFQDPF